MKDENGLNYKYEQTLLAWCFIYGWNGIFCLTLGQQIYLIAFIHFTFPLVRVKMPVAKFPTFQQQVHGGEDKGQGKNNKGQ